MPVMLDTKELQIIYYALGNMKVCVKEASPILDLSNRIKFSYEELIKESIEEKVEVIEIPDPQPSEIPPSN